MQITCEQCNATFAPTSGAQERIYHGYSEFGIACPGCGVWTHAYYMTPALLEEQTRLRVRQERHEKKPTEASWEHYQWQLGAYKRAYTRTQKRIQKKRGKA